MTAAARNFDVLVVGGGPAGMTAATAVRRHGGSVALIDENTEGGGQVYRPQPRGFGRSSEPSAEQRQGAEHHDCGDQQNFGTAEAAAGGMVMCGRAEHG